MLARACGFESHQTVGEDRCLYFCPSDGSVGRMANKLKIAAMVVTLVVGMILYKDRFDRLEKEKKVGSKA